MPAKKKKKKKIARRKRRVRINPNKALKECSLEELEEYKSLLLDQESFIEQQIAEDPLFNELIGVNFDIKIPIGKNHKLDIIDILPFYNSFGELVLYVDDISLEIDNIRSLPALKALKSKLSKMQKIIQQLAKKYKLDERDIAEMSNLC